MSKKALLPILIFVLSVVFFACSKQEGSVFSGKTQSYKLYDSTGKGSATGSFTIFELPDKNARLSLKLNAIPVAGPALQAGIFTKDTLGIQHLYSKLADLNNATAISETALLVNDSSRNIKYADIITSKGYFVKVFNGNGVKAVGPIE